MNNEFKKIKTRNETRYILETASAGATSAGAVATAPSNLGALRRRLEELKAKLSVPRAKPRNPVGMGSTQGRGTQKHQPNQRQTARDEKKMQGVAEGKFVKADGGVPSDRHGNPLPPKPPKSVSTMTLKQLEKNKRENPGQSSFKTQDEKVKKYLGLEEEGVAESISIKSTDDSYNIVNSKGEVIKQFHKTPKGLEYAKQFLKQNKGNTGLDENTVAEEIGHDQVSPKQARYILRLAQDHSIEQILDDFPELFRMMSIIAGERGLDLDDNWDDVVEILLNDLEDIVQQDNDQNYNDDDMKEGSWGNFNSSDEQWGVDTDRYTGYRGVGGYRRREPDEQLPKSAMTSNRGMYFYNVKPGQEQLAQQAGLTQSKSGKWYSKSKIDSVEKQFGPGKYWEPKSESTLTELEKPSGTMFLKFREKQTPDDEPVVYGYGGFGTTPKDVKVINALIKPFPIVDSYDVINKMEKIFKDKDFIGIEKIVLDIPGNLEGKLHDVIDYAEQDPERFDLYIDNSNDEPEVRTGGKVIGYGPDGKRINREPAKAQVGGSSRGVANTGMVTVQADSTGQKLINGLLSQGKLSRDTKVQGNKITLRKDDYSKMLAVLGNAKFQQMFSKTGNVTENDKPDHEISMASSELASITKDAAELLAIVKQRSEEEGLEAWQQSKITKAADYMNSVLRSISSDQELDVNEGLRDPKDNPCWKGYKPVGTKKKNGRTVPNCVPKNEDTYISKLNGMLEQLKKN